MSKIIELKSVPSTLSYYLRALTVSKSGQLPVAESELGRAVLKGRRVNVSSLNAYREACAFSARGSLPATYPFVLAAPLHMELLVSDAFPFRVLGLVHLRNEIIQHRTIGVDETLDIDCTLRGPRPVPKGMEFDLYTRVLSGQELLWECVTTMLRRGGGSRPASRAHNKRKTVDFTPDSVSRWDVPAGTGRRYARVSGDSNPIHLSALTARLFGFRRAIVHGMWTKARCLAELDSLLPGDAFKVSVSFKLPVFLPSSVQFQQRAVDGSIEFAVKDSAGKKPHLTGVIESL
ncbi:MaoC/PaaZ C-terminal domain-containing protein [Microbulbifer thermotolerans]|uniref:MaoC family dehydratase n=1 Tax=Microbulbifer thermotolerans TaxID=252514 RepID=UPI002248E75B|nr:MaoC/PaaZ C-terminal domain-containing protein [Microbulbifer thermotolerans]MCX2781431.1 MaoC/PaaZ C-terminal domain-containing protein [Microbulbifer thermotolerans]MCX2793822.1 MaoC/PaaZ C-terminal domain-containing protein [Microbulbifer thermotolerans]MCX2835944.1 MaoC/PaaZ C-terminal domain-containing protein [Microbulbifer thermotolerans]